MKNYFTYLKNSPGKINFIFGDARLSLEKMPLGNYDLFIIDAFNGDSIPIHLLTTQAIIKYKKYLRENGVLLFHVTNQYLNFLPVLAKNAETLDVYAGSKENANGPGHLYFSRWVIYTWNEEILNELVSRHQWMNLAEWNEKRNIKPWTDEYSSLLTIFDFKRANF